MSRSGDREPGSPDASSIPNSYGFRNYLEQGDDPRGVDGIAMDQQYIMTDSCFTSEVRLGCVSIKNADQLPLDGARLDPRRWNRDLGAGFI